MDGKDVRLYSVRGGVTTELHRVLDPASSWNHTTTRLWFRVDGPVEPLAIQEDVYFLVFEDKSPEPLHDPNQVFVLYDDFNQSALDLGRWGLKTSEDVPGVVQDIRVVGGELALSSGPSGPGLVASAGVRSRMEMNSNGLAVESSLRFEMHTASNDCTLEDLAGFWSHGQDMARAVWQRGGNVWHVLNDTSESEVSRRFLGSRPSTGDSRRFMLRWNTPTVMTYAESLDQGKVTLSSTTFKTPAAGPLNFGFGTHADGLSCNDRASKLWVDWVFVRKIHSELDLTAAFLADKEVTKQP